MCIMCSIFCLGRNAEVDETTQGLCGGSASFFPIRALHAVINLQVAPFSVEREKHFQPSDDDRLFSSAECSLLLYHCIEDVSYSVVSIAGPCDFHGY